MTVIGIQCSQGPTQWGPFSFNWSKSTFTCITYWASLISACQNMFETLCKVDPGFGLTYQQKKDFENIPSFQNNIYFKPFLLLFLRINRSNVLTFSFSSPQ
jgi:hypothetical protein